MSRRVRWLVPMSLIVAAAGVLVAWLTSSSGPDYVRRTLAAVFAAPAETCASVDDKEWSPSSFYRVPVGFAELAVERAGIVCNDAGPSTYYFRFRDHPSLERALRRFPGVVRLRLCAVGDAVFTGDAMDSDPPPSEPHPFESACTRLHGQLLRE